MWHCLGRWSNTNNLRRANTKRIVRKWGGAQKLGHATAVSHLFIFHSNQAVRLCELVCFLTWLQDVMWKSEKCAGKCANAWFTVNPLLVSASKPSRPACLWYAGLDTFDNAIWWTARVSVRARVCLLLLHVQALKCVCVRKEGERRERDTERKSGRERNAMSWLL